MFLGGDLTYLKESGKIDSNGQVSKAKDAFNMPRLLLAQPTLPRNLRPCFLNPQVEIGIGACRMGLDRAVDRMEW